VIIRSRYPYTLPLAADANDAPVLVGEKRVGTVVEVQEEDGCAIIVMEVDDAYATIFTQPPVVSIP
jgi:hypothetical protein